MEGIPMKLKLQLLLASTALVALAGCAAGGGSGVSVAGLGDSKGCRTGALHVFFVRRSATVQAWMQPVKLPCGNVPRDGFFAAVEQAGPGPGRRRGQYRCRRRPMKVSISKPAGNHAARLARRRRPILAPVTRCRRERRHGRVHDARALRLHRRQERRRSLGELRHPRTRWRSRRQSRWRRMLEGRCPSTIRSRGIPQRRPSAPGGCRLAAGRPDTAKTTMAGLRRILPGATLVGHRRALLAEGAGDIGGALKIDASPRAPGRLHAAARSRRSGLARLSRQGERGVQQPAASGAAPRRTAARCVNRDGMSADRHSPRAFAEAAKDDGYVKDRPREGDEEGRPPRRAHAQPGDVAFAIADEAATWSSNASRSCAHDGEMARSAAQPPFNYLICVRCARVRCCSIPTMATSACRR